MARIAGIIEARREAQEGQQFKLGRGLVFLGMARERVHRAIEMTQMHGLLDPADEYLAEVARCIRDAQAGLADREAKL